MYQQHQNDVNLSKSGPQEEQIPSYVMRDDILNFSTELAMSNRNRYRKRTNNNNKNVMNLVNIIRQGTKEHIDDQKSTKIALNSLHSHRTNITQHTSADRLVNKQRQSAESVRYSKREHINYSGSSEAFREKSQVNKRQIFTVKNRRSSFQKNKNQWHNFNFKKQKMNEITQEQNREEVIQNTYEDLQKKYNKKGIKASSVIQWLNQALIEATPGIQVNKNIAEAAIKYYYIDRSSLISKGIHPDALQRLYKSLFVYSIGFNNLLKEICHSNMSIRKSVWKVYAILLEYCSGGTFQTMIGQIQRDKTQRLNQLKQQIKKRQKIIEQNEQINEEKNAKIYRQVKELKERTKNLQEEKEILMKDFHEAEQAFNQEIILRLKYQNRINQIHGVYEEIRTKSDGLRQSHLKQAEIINQQKLKIDNLTNQVVSLTAQLDHEVKQKRLLENLKKVLEDQVTNLQKNLRTTGMNYYSVKNSSQSKQTVITELHRKLEQMDKRITISKSSEQSTTKSLKVSNEEYEKSLRENIELHETSKIQMAKISDLMEEIRRFGSSTSQLQAEIRIRNERIKQNKILIDQLNQQINNNKVKEQKDALLLLTEKQQKEALKLDLQQCLKNIKIMRQKQQDLQTSYHNTKTENMTLNQMITQKQKQTQRLKEEITEQNRKISEMTKKLQQKQTAISILQQKINIQNQLNKQRYNKLQSDYEKIKKEHDKHLQVKNNLEEEVEKNRQLYENMFSKFKNQKFERTNLELRYDQSLTVMEEENSHIKKLNIHISELNQTIDQYKRKIVNNEYIYTEEKKRLASQSKFWKTKFDKIQTQANNLKMHVHPLKYEDLYGQLIRVSEKNIQLVKQNKQIKQKKGIQKSLQKQISIKSQQLQSHYKQKQKFIKSILQKTQKQLQFQKQKNSYHHKKLQQMQTDLQRHQSETTSIIEQYRENETQANQKLKERNINIKNLNKKIQELFNQKDKIIKENEQYRKKHEIMSADMHKGILPNFSKTNKNMDAGESSPKLGKNNHIKKSKLRQQGYQKMQDNNSDQSIHVIQSKYAQNSPIKSQRRSANSQKQYLNQQQKVQMAAEAHVDQQSPKKRQDIRKKLKGAYMYYHK